MTLHPELQKRVHPYKLPPAGFDPLSATERALEELGLPPRPPTTQPESLDFWTELMSPPLLFVEPKFGAPTALKTLTMTVGSAARAPRPTFSGRGHAENSRNWSGLYVKPRTGQRFTMVAGAWRVPTPSVPDVLPMAGDPDDKYRAEFRSSIWVGLGGHRTYPNVSIPQIGTRQYLKSVNGQMEPELGVWWQWWSTDGGTDEIPITSVPIRAGDQFLAAVVTVSSDEAVLYIKNQTSGEFTWVLVQAPPNSEPLGSTAEWVVERPTWPAATFPSRMPKLTDVDFRHCFALSGPRIIGPQLLHRLDNARFIRMQERFDSPYRTALISMPERTGPTSARVRYREATPDRP